MFGIERIGAAAAKVTVEVTGNFRVPRKIKGTVKMWCKLLLALILMELFYIPSPKTAWDTVQGQVILDCLSLSWLKGLQTWNTSGICLDGVAGELSDDHNLYLERTFAECQFT